MPDHPVATHVRAYSAISSSMRWYSTGSLPAMPRSSSCRRPMVTYMNAWKSITHLRRGRRSSLAAPELPGDRLRRGGEVAREALHADVPHLVRQADHHDDMAHGVGRRADRRGDHGDALDVVALVD